MAHFYKKHPKSKSPIVEKLPSKCGQDIKVKA